MTTGSEWSNPHDLDPDDFAVPPYLDPGYHEDDEPDPWADDDEYEWIQL